MKNIPQATAADWLAADARISPQHDRDEAAAISAGNLRLANLIAHRRNQWQAALNAICAQEESGI